MRWYVAVSLILLAAGCVTPPPGSGPPTITLLTAAEIDTILSQPKFEAAPPVEASVAAADGEIRVELRLPADARDPLPTILVITPYRSLASADPSCGPSDRLACAYLPALVEFFVPRGYAVAFAAARGSHGSSGCFDFAGPETMRDGVRVAEWIAEQSWSNGRVGLYGDSFDGTLAIGVAAEAPQTVRTIVPLAPPISRYASNFYDGVPYFAAGPGRFAQYEAVASMPAPQGAAAPTRFDCTADVAARETEQAGDWNAYWEERDLRTRARNINASVLLVQGLQDDTVRPHEFDEFWENLTAEKRLILGNWAHETPRRGDWPAILHRWFDHFLLDRDTGILQDLPAALVNDEAGDWWGFDSYPPADLEWLRLYPASDGSLDNAGVSADEVVVRDYPRGSVSGPIGGILALPAAIATGEPAEVAFETEPLPDPVRLLGRPRLGLHARTDATSTHWTARLESIPSSPDAVGSRFGETYIMNRGFADTRHRFGVDQPLDVQPGEVYTLLLRFLPQAEVIEAGHTLRLVLGNNDNWVQQDTTFARSAVALGPGSTFLELPVVTSGVRVPGDALREDL